MHGRSEPVPASRAVLEAIEVRRCVSARYNNVVIILAPHILYTRHGEPYVDAVTVQRDGKPPKEVKLSSFKLDGLHDLELDARGFDPDPRFDAKGERYTGQTLFAV